MALFLLRLLTGYLHMVVSMRSQILDRPLILDTPELRGMFTFDVGMDIGIVFLAPIT